MHWLKAVHLVCVVLSFAGFVSRGVLMLRGSPLLHARLTRIAPHVVDTVLLASAVGMVVSWRLSPLEQSWLLAKLLALVVYIVLGLIAMRLGRSLRVRAGAWLLALVVYAYIVAVALTKSPWVVLA